MSTEIIKPSTNDIVQKQDEINIVSKLSKHKIVQSLGGIDSYIADKIIDTAENAMVADNRGTLQIDSKTRLKAIDMLIKVADKSYDRKGINLNFFAAPRDGEY